MGDGYSFVNAALMGGVTWAALLTFGVLKQFATSLTVGSGGSGGVFAPTLYIGAGLGGAFGFLLKWLAPSSVSSPAAYALVGMAAMFAGAAHVPVTCIVLIMEVTNSYEMILPLMIAVSSSYLVGSAVMADSLYTISLHKRGITLRHGIYIDALRAIRVSQIMTMNPITLKPGANSAEALRLALGTHHSTFPIIDADGKIVGTITTEDLLQASRDTSSEQTVEQLASRDFLRVNPEMTMDSVFHLMTSKKKSHAIVVDPSQPDKMLGLVTHTDLLRAYESATALSKSTGEFSED
jgi:CIC family chloride channel protein